MIRRAEKKDLPGVMEYLNKEGSVNTAPLAYLEKYGLEKDFQNVWLYEGESAGEPRAVLVRHFNSLYICGGNPLIDMEELGSFASFIGSDIISGKLELLSEMALYLDGMILEPSCHMVLLNQNGLKPCTRVQKAGLEDCRELSELIYSIPEFARFYSSNLEIERGIRRRLELGICRYFVLKLDGIIVSQAYTTIESGQHATIGGVVTREEYRKQGLASLVVSCISLELLRDGKKPNLFCSNDEAERVYTNLGFVPVTEYAMLLDHRYCIKKE